MIGIIISAHGKFASGLKSSLELVIGEHKNIKCIDFDGTEVNDYIDNFKALIEEMIAEYDLLAIVTDIKGGTPYNIAAKFTINKDNTLVFSGANFQLVYELLNLNNKSEDFVDTVVEKARKEIDYFDIDRL